MKERFVPWPKHVKISKEDFRPYIDVGDLIESEKSKEMLDSDEAFDLVPALGEESNSFKD